MTGPFTPASFLHRGSDTAAVFKSGETARNSRETGSTTRQTGKEGLSMLTAVSTMVTGLPTAPMALASIYTPREPSTRENGRTIFSTDSARKLNQIRVNIKGFTREA